MPDPVLENNMHRYWWTKSKLLEKKRKLLESISHSIGRMQHEIWLNSLNNFTSSSSSNWCPFCDQLILLHISLCAISLVVLSHCTGLDYFLQTGCTVHSVGGVDSSQSHFKASQLSLAWEKSSLSSATVPSWARFGAVVDPKSTKNTSFWLICIKLF